MIWFTVLKEVWLGNIEQCLKNSMAKIISSQHKQYMVYNIFFSVWKSWWSQIFNQMWFLIVQATSQFFSLSSTGLVVFTSTGTVVRGGKIRMILRARPWRKHNFHEGGPSWYAVQETVAAPLLTRFVFGTIVLFYIAISLYLVLPEAWTRNLLDYESDSLTRPWLPLTKKRKKSDLQMRRTIEAIRPMRDQQYTSAVISLS